MNQLYRIFYRLRDIEWIRTPPSNLPPFVPGDAHRQIIWHEMEVKVDLNEISAISGSSQTTDLQQPGSVHCQVFLRSGQVLNLEEMPPDSYKELLEVWSGWQEENKNLKDWRKESNEAIWEDL